MNSANLQQRLVGVCTFSCFMLGSLKIKLAAWSWRHPMPYLPSNNTALAVCGVVTLVAALETWRQKPWGYVLCLLLLAAEGIMTAQTSLSSGSFYQQEVDLLDLALAELPFVIGVVSAVALLLQYGAHRQSGMPK